VTGRLSIRNLPASSVTGHGLDGVTGQMWQRKVTPDPADILAWVSTLPGPVKVT
jgi:hypothetical protein